MKLEKHVTKKFAPTLATDLKVETIFRETLGKYLPAIRREIRERLAKEVSPNIKLCSPRAKRPVYPATAVLGNEWWVGFIGQVKYEAGQFRYPLNQAQLNLLQDIIRRADGSGNQWWPGLPKGLLTEGFKEIIKEEVQKKFPRRKDILVEFSDGRVDVLPKDFSIW